MTDRPYNTTTWIAAAKDTLQPPASLAAALAVLQTRLPDIKRTETAVVESQKGRYSYTYASLAAITRELMPLLGELGLSFIAKPTVSGDGKMVLAYKLLHVSGEFEAGEYPLIAATGTSQALGSAITYGRRYALCAVTGVAADDDDDAQAADAAPKRRSRKQPPPDPEPDDDWDAAVPATELQASTFDALSSELEAMTSPADMVTVGAKAKAALADGRLTKAQYDRLEVYAGKRLAELKAGAS